MTDEHELVRFREKHAMRPPFLSALFATCCLPFLGLACTVTGLCTGTSREDAPQYAENPFVIELAIPAADDGTGGIIVADVNDDGRLDYLVTKPGHLAVYGHDGEKLWVKRTDIRVAVQSERSGLPGGHGPGVQAADVDRNGHTEVLFLTQDGAVHVVDGQTGEEKMSSRPPVPEGAERWEHLVVANFRGRGDCDLLLQATCAEGYRYGRYMAAFALEKGGLQTLWQTDSYSGCAHNGARVADLDGDGRDEVAGGTIIDSDGTVLRPFDAWWHMDSMFIYDVRPDLPGLEVVTLEEGHGNHVCLFNMQELIWRKHYEHQEPQNAAVGDFDTERGGLEIWCRSRYDEHQKPFVFDAGGELIAHYQMDDVAPEGWTTAGVEVISVIDWTGEKKQLAAAKERHTAGDVCIFDPITGRFVEQFEEKADRIYVADVSGDWREEVIVLNGNEIHVYHNPAENAAPQRPRLWTQQQYARSKMTWNYYSP